MEINNPIITNKNKGGRPKKITKRTYRLRVACNLFELKTIELKAKNTQLTLSEYLRTMAINSHIDIKQKTLPKEVLAFIGTLNHIAANLNQFTKMNNRFHNFDALERAELKVLCNQVKQLVIEIKNYLR